MANTPKVAAMEVYPVAGKDCMELNLSGAHAPYFPRPGEREAPGGGHQRGRLQDDPAEAQRVAHGQY